MDTRNRIPPAMLLIGVSLVVAAAVWGLVRRQPASAPIPGQAVGEDVARIRAALAEELRPVTLSNCDWVRVGSANDGGYAMCGNLLEGVETAYSYGIGGNDDWGCQVSRAHKIPVHQYDCFNPKSAPCAGADLRLNVECVGARQEAVDGRPFDTLANQIARNGDGRRTKVVKMDIEGGEWPSLLAAPDDLFDTIVQMPMELHGTDIQDVLDGIRKLKQHFYVVALHFNNWQCSSERAPFPNFAYQVLLVNKKVGRLGEPRAGAPTLESALAPDNPSAPECTYPVRSGAGR